MTTSDPRGRCCARMKREGETNGECYAPFRWAGERKSTEYRVYEYRADPARDRRGPKVQGGLCPICWSRQNWGTRLSSTTLPCATTRGTASAKDPERAFYWFSEAALLGDVRAIAALGRCYQFGAGVKQDLEKAREQYELAADQDYAPALCDLGLCYENGTGVAKDEAMAAELYARAAEQEYAPAFGCLGLCYEMGTGVEMDKLRATELYAQSAELGYAPAQCNLGFCHLTGIGVPVDAGKAVPAVPQSGGTKFSAGHRPAGKLLL